MVAKKSVDIIDKWIKSVNWKLGNFSMLPIFFGTLMALVDIMMMGSIKMINQGTLSSSWGIPLSVGLYALEPLIFLKALNYEGMVVTNLVWNLMSDVIVTLQGVLLFGESIKGLRWVGVCMSLFSLGLMAYTDTV
jgi:multidrug transporter EmrE-like cation transporter